MHLQRIYRPPSDAEADELMETLAQLLLRLVSDVPPCDSVAGTAAPKKDADA